MSAGRPTAARVQDAYAILFQNGVEVVGDFALRTIATIARGSPEYEPTRYSDAEVRLAELVLVLRADVLEAVQTMRATIRVAGGPL